MEKIKYKCLSCNENLVGRQRKYCSSKCCEFYRRYNNVSRIAYIKKYRSEYREINRDVLIEISKKYYEGNKDKKRIYDVNYYKENEEKIKEYQKKYKRKRQKEDPIYRVNSSMSRGIYFSLKNNNLSKNRRHWENIVGYTIQDLKEHIEELFQPGMSWNNYGRWHFDHIIPKSFFKFKSTDDVEFKYCWSLANLQPLWEKDNIKKIDKIMLWGKEIDARNVPCPHRRNEVFN